MNKKRLFLISIFILILIGFNYFFIVSDYSDMEYYNLRISDWYFLSIAFFSISILIYSFIKKYKDNKKTGEKLYDIYYFSNIKWQKVVMIYFLIILVILTAVFISKPSITNGFSIYLILIGAIYTRLFYSKQYIAENGIVIGGGLIFWHDIKSFKLIEEKHKIEINAVIKGKYSTKFKISYSIKDENEIVDFLSRFTNHSL